MKRLTQSELSILGLIAEGPKHGYQIEQDIQARGMREWTDIGFSSIYYILNKLEENGWLESSHQSAGDRPARKVYRLTGEGMGAFQEAVRTVLSEPRPHSGDFDLGLANLSALPPSEALAALQTYSTRMGQQMEHVRAQLANARRGPTPWHIEALFDHSLTAMQCELDWVSKAIQTLQKEAGSHEQG